MKNISFSIIFGDRVSRFFDYVFLPYCVGEQLFDSDNYGKFVKGTGYDRFYQYIDSSNEIKEIINRTMYSSTSNENRDYKKDLKIVYDAIYNQDKEYFNIKVGNIEINLPDIQYFNDLCTILTDFTIK